MRRHSVLLLLTLLGILLFTGCYSTPRNSHSGRPPRKHTVIRPAPRPAKPVKRHSPKHKPAPSPHRKPVRH